MTGLTGDGFFARFIESAKAKSSSELAGVLEEDRTLSQVHEEHALAGQTAVRARRRPSLETGAVLREPKGACG